MNYEYEFEVNTPQEFIFEQFTNYNELARHAPAHAIVRPHQDNDIIREGDAWTIHLKRGGQKIQVETKVVELRSPDFMRIHAESNRIETHVDFQLTKVAEEQTIVKASFDLKPKGLLGRILLQSMKASGKRVRGAFDRGSLRLAEYLEDRYDELNS